jgi:hypothetical protein
MAVVNAYLDDGALVQRFSANVNGWPKTGGICSAETSQLVGAGNDTRVGCFIWS